MVPMFKKLYLGLGDELFWLTRVLLNLCDSLRIHLDSRHANLGNSACCYIQNTGVFVVAESDSR